MFRYMILCIEETYYILLDIGIEMPKTSRKAFGHYIVLARGNHVESLGTIAYLLLSTTGS